MGRGNFIPNGIRDARGRGIDAHYRMVYVDRPTPEDEDGEPDYDLARTMNEYFLDDLENLCTRFSKTGRLIGDEYHGQNERILFRNNALEVTVADNEGSLAVVVRQVEPDDYEPRNISGLTERHVDIFAVKLFGKLREQGLSLRIPYGAWTSGKWNGDIAST